MYFYFWGAVDSGYHHNTFGRRLNNFCYKLLSTLNKGQTTNNKKNWRWILDCSTLCQVKIKLRLLHHNFQFHSLYYFYNMGHPKLQRMQDCVSWWHLPLGIANISEILSHKTPPHIIINAIYFDWRSTICTAQKFLRVLCWWLACLIQTTGR